MRFKNQMIIFSKLRALFMAFCVLVSLLLPFMGTGLFPVPAALAEEDAQLLRISISTQPDALAEPEDVALTLSIENRSDTDAQNVYISSADGLLSEPIGQVLAGKTLTLTRPHSVSQEELEAGLITYIISHDDPDEPGHKINYTVQTPIYKSDLQPRVEFTRQFSSRYVSPGSTVTITYRIRNTGNAVLSSLQVQDELGDFTGRVERLEVGESRTLISRVTLNEADTSVATLTYDVDVLDESFVTTLSEAPVRIAYGQIDAVLSASYAPFSTDTAEVVLLLTNLGNVDYTNIRISDDVYGGVIADNVVLPGGSADPIEISATYPVRGSQGFRWHITGLSEAGERVDFVTETVVLAPLPVSFPDEVTLNVEVLTPNIRRAGDVPVMIRIENAGDGSVSNITVYEASQGVQHTFLILPAGGAIEREIPIYVSASGTLSFTLSYTDVNGNARGVIASPVDVVISADGVDPEGTEERFFEFSGTSIKIGGSSTFAVLLIIGSAVLLVLIITLLVISRKARLEKKLRVAAERQRRKGETPKPASARPAGKAANGAKKAKK